MKKWEIFLRFVAIVPMLVFYPVISVKMYLFHKRISNYSCGIFALYGILGMVGMIGFAIAGFVPMPQKGIIVILAAIPYLSGHVGQAYQMSPVWE